MPNLRTRQRRCAFGANAGTRIRIAQLDRRQSARVLNFGTRTRIVGRKRPASDIAKSEAQYGMQSHSMASQWYQRWARTRDARPGRLFEAWNCPQYRLSLSWSHQTCQPGELANARVMLATARQERVRSGCRPCLALCSFCTTSQQVVMRSTGIFNHTLKLQ